MKRIVKVAGFGLPLMLAAAGVFSSPAAAQAPVVVPIVVDTAAPIIISAVKPKPKLTGLDKFQGFVMHANNAQITVRAKGNDMAIRTFPLSEAASAKMQKIVDKGGYQPVRRQSDGFLRTRYFESDQVQRETLEAHLIRGAAACFACLRLPDASIPPILRN